MTTKEQSGIDDAQDALNRLSRAMRRGTGCHLTADMVSGLSITLVGEICAQADPRGQQDDGEAV